MELFYTYYFLATTVLAGAFIALAISWALGLLKVRFV